MQAENIFVALRENDQLKAILDRNKIKMDWVVDAGVLKQ